MSESRPARPEVCKTILSMKDLSKIIGVLGVVISLIAWVHAEFTVPRILNTTANQMKDAIKDHVNFTHPGSATRREIELLQKGIEDSINSLRSDTNQRLNRIEQKVDRL